MTICIPVALRMKKAVYEVKGTECSEASLADERQKEALLSQPQRLTPLLEHNR